MASSEESQIQLEASQEGEPLMSQIMSLVNSNQLKLGPGDVIRVINLDGSESETLIEVPETERDYEEGAEVDHVTAEGDAIVLSADSLTNEPLENLVSSDSVKLQFTKGYICGICDKQLATAGSLNLHMRIHTGEKPFKCLECDESFARSSFLTYHMRIHTGRNPFVCKSCGAELSSASNLSRHEKLHDEEKPFQCHLCSAAFIQRPHYKEHLRKHTGELPFKCDECDARFLRSYSLRLHKDKHRAGIYSCNVCGVTFTNMSALRRHQPVHRSRARFSCPMCDAIFLGASALQSHLRMHRQSDNQHLASSDDEGIEFEVHSDSETIPEDDFWCQVCNKTFLDSESLLANLNSHGLQLPIRCRKCEDKFDDLEKFATHRADGLCWFVGDDLVCKLCGQKSLRKYDLKKHMKTHRGPQPYSCDRCSAVFARAGNLAAHMNLHLETVPYTCHVCEAKFYDKRLYSKHFRSHPKDHLPVRCNVCRDRLKNAQELKEHLAEYHQRHQANSNNQQ